MTGPLPGEIEALVRDRLATAFTWKENWGLPGHRARYREEVIEPLLRAVDPEATLRPDRGLDAAVAAETGLVPATFGIAPRWSHLVRGRTDGVPYQLAHFEGVRKSTSERRIVEFDGLLAQALLGADLEGRTVVAPEGERLLAEPVNAPLQSLARPDRPGVAVWTTCPDEARRLVTPSLAQAVSLLWSRHGRMIRIGFAGRRVSVAWEVGEVFHPQGWRPGEEVDGLRWIATCLIEVRRLLSTAAAACPPAPEGDVDALFGDRVLGADFATAVAALRSRGLDVRADDGALVLRYAAASRLARMALVALPWPVLGISLHGRVAGWPGDGALLAWIAALHPVADAAVRWLAEWAPWTTFFLVTTPVTGAWGAQRMPREVVITRDEVRVIPMLWPRPVTTRLDGEDLHVRVQQQVVSLGAGYWRRQISPMLPPEDARELGRVVGGFTGAEVHLERHGDER